MRAVLAAYGIENRRVFVADSFEGLPKPDVATYPADIGDLHHTVDVLKVGQEEVESNFQKHGLLDDQVIFLRGWFRDSLPRAPIDQLSVMRLDGDMYGSTMDALTTLYPKLSTGGYCIIDDYALDGCRKAVDDYRMEHRIASEMCNVDWTGRFWRKDA
jgi:O-methyltransferase